MNDKLILNHICDVLSAPVENSYEFPSCSRARNNPSSFFKNRKEHSNKWPVLHQPHGATEHGTVFGFACRIPELSNYSEKSLKMQIPSQEKCRYRPDFYLFLKEGY